MACGFLGIKWAKSLGFNQIAEYPLAGASREEILRYRFPSEHLTELLQLMLPVIKQQRDYFIGCDVSPCAFEMYWRLRGMENANLDMATDPELASAMLGRCADFAVELSQGACQQFALDWLWTGDDVSSQLGMIMSRRCGAH